MRTELFASIAVVHFRAAIGTEPAPYESDARLLQMLVAIDLEAGRTLEHQPDDVLVLAAAALTLKPWHTAPPAMV